MAIIARGSTDRRTGRGAWRAALLATVAMPLASEASAQDGTALADDSVDEIIVTGYRQALRDAL